MLTQLTTEFKFIKPGTIRPRWYAYYQCECGEVKLIQTQNVESGNTSTCGCGQREACRVIGQANRVHGAWAEDASVEQRIWIGMIRRCYSFEKPAYFHVNVCTKWLQSFEAFLEDMGPRPSSEYDIDRINPSGDYEPSNCRWLHRSENRSRKHYRETQGVLAPWEQR